MALSFQIGGAIIRTSDKEEKPLSEANKRLVHRFIDEVWNKRNLAVVEQFIAAEYTTHDPAARDIGNGPEAVKKLVTMYHVNAFPDSRLKIEEILDDVNKVILRWSAVGTHKGELMGIAPTDKQVSVAGITIYRIAKGRIVEDWSNWDTLGLLRQLGAVCSSKTKTGATG